MDSCYSLRLHFLCPPFLTVPRISQLDDFGVLIPSFNSRRELTLALTIEPEVEMNPYASLINKGQSGALWE